MRNINEIMALGDAQLIYTMLTSKKKPFIKEFNEVMCEYNPYQHKVMDETKRKKKTIRVKTEKIGQDGKPIYKDKRVERCRIAIPAQKVIVERSVGFLFSNPVEYQLKDDTDDTEKKNHDKILSTLEDNKIEYFDKKLSRTLFIERECAELWYFEYDENMTPSAMKLKLLCKSKGDELYPHFNDYGKMDGFARKYVVHDELGSAVTHFDVYTDRYCYAYEFEANGIVKKNAVPKLHGFTKIPIIYYRQERSEWDDVQIAIERIEELLSNWGDINDYYGSPSYYVKGKLNGFADKGEVGRIYKNDDGGGDMKVLSWDSSPVSMSTELANLFNIVFSYTQTPDISFENMKSLGGNTSGVAIRLMFTDPHMKGNIKIETFGEMYTRRYNVVKSGHGAIGLHDIADSDMNKLIAKPIFKLFLPKNDLETIQMINASTGGKATMSQKAGVAKNPLVTNPDETMKELEEEQKAAMLENVMGSAQ